MATQLELKDRFGRTIAKGRTSRIHKVLDHLNHAHEYWKLVMAKMNGKNYTGYVKDSDLEGLNVSTVAIPANFAGLEAVSTPTRLEDQYFEITEVVENEDYVEVTAEHIFYRMRQNYTLWKPTENTQYTGAAALRNIMTNAVSELNFDAASDCTDMLQGSELDFERKNIVEALLDPNNGLCAKYGLSLIRDNDVFYCLKEVGYDRGMVIQNEKNLLGVERKENIENVVTRVAPIGKTAKGDVVWLNYDNKKYIDSQFIGDYAEPKCEIYDTGLQIGKDDVTEQNIQAKLLEAAQKRFTEDKVDIPELTMTIEFISLGDTEEYAQYRGLDKVYLYDILTIKDTVRGYNYSAQVIGVEHDILTGMLLSVKIGSITNADDTRKIATWQVPEIDGSNIRLKTILAGSFADGAINTDDIASGAISYLHLAAATIDDLTADSITAVTAHIHEIIAGSITADDITAGSITTETLAANAITAEKIAASAITTDKLAANSITSEKITASAITTDKLAANSITSEKINAGAITATTIASGAVTAIKIAADAVTADKISAGAVTADKIYSGAVTADKIDAGAVTAAKIAAGAVTTEKLEAGAVTANKIDANAITADKISATDLAAIQAKLQIASIANAQINSADINYAHVKDLTADTAIFETSITEQGVADRLYINRLLITYGQMVEATIGDLVIGASDGHYYHVDVEWDEYGVPSLVPTQVATPSAAEIAAGHTSNGQTIIGNVGTFAELSSEDFYAINSIIDRITAKRIDVDQLWARQAFIDKLMVQDISSNTYIQSTIGNWAAGSTITQTVNGILERITQLGYGTIYMQSDEPNHSELVSGDLWVQTMATGSWQSVYNDHNSWQEIYNTYDAWQVVGSVPKVFVWDGQGWQELYDAEIASNLETEIQQLADAISLRATKTEVELLSGEVSEFAATLSVQAQQIESAVSAVNAKAASYVMYLDPRTAYSVTLGDIWVKQPEGIESWEDIYEYNSWQEIYNTFDAWKDFIGSETYVWDGEKWVMTSDRATEIDQSTQITQTSTAVSFLAQTTATLQGEQIRMSSELTVANDRINAEVSRATTAEGSLNNKTRYLQTSGLIQLEAFTTGTSGTALGLISRAGIEIDGSGKITANAMSTDAKNAINKAAGIEVDGNGKITINALVNDAKNAINKAAGITVDGNGKIELSALTQTVQGTINKAAGITVDANGKIELSAMTQSVQNTISKAAGITVDATTGEVLLSAAKFDSLGNSTESKIYISPDTISIGTNGTFTLSSSNLTVLADGSMTAKALTLQGGSILIKDGNTENFKVTNKGFLTAKGVSISGTVNAAAGSFTGTVTASAGAIGGFAITANQLSSGDAATKVALNSAAGNDYAFWCGANSAGSAPFSVKKSGEIKSTSGTIGGFTITSTSIYSGDGASRVALYNGSGDYAFWCGANTAASAPFRVKKNGEVVLTKLLIQNEQGQTSEFNLNSGGLWKLNYKTVKDMTASTSGDTTTLTLQTSDGNISVNFNSAAGARAQGWANAANTVTAVTFNTVSHVVWLYVPTTTVNQTQMVTDGGQAYAAGWVAAGGSATRDNNTITAVYASSTPGTKTTKTFTATPSWNAQEAMTYEGAIWFKGITVSVSWSESQA